MNERLQWGEEMIGLYNIKIIKYNRSASCATRDSGFVPRVCRSQPRPGGPWGDAQFVVRVREDLAGRDILVSSRTRHLAQCTLTKVARCTVFPPTHWWGWLPGWMRAVLRSSAAWVGCVSKDAWLPTFVSPEPVREL